MSILVNISTSVIIPYFQRERGILIKSIQSVLNQKNIDLNNVEIIVVDDSSPISAKSELALINLEQYNIRIINQTNKGPASARNTGLNSISDSTQYIAFLDSDDEWTRNHLGNAIKALSAGYDFYFSDFYQLDQSITAFNRAKRIDIKEHPSIFGDNDSIRHYTGNMTDQIITGNIIGTSTVVYRLESNPQLRFREELVRCGEDYLFWLDITAKNKIAFSSEPECVYGKGVNIYSGVEFGSTEFLELTYYETRYRLTILREFTLNKKQAEFLQKKRFDLKINFLKGLLNRLKNRNPISFYLILKYLRCEPGFIFEIPYLLYKVICEKNKFLKK